MGLRGQRGARFELIVADDGSGPATVEVIDRVSSATGLDVITCGMRIEASGRPRF